MPNNPIRPEDVRPIFLQAVATNDTNCIKNLSRRIFETVSKNVAREDADAVLQASVKMQAAAMMAASIVLTKDDGFNAAVENGDLENFHKDAYFACHKMLWDEVAIIAFREFVEAIADNMRIFMLTTEMPK